MEPIWSFCNSLPEPKIQLAFIDQELSKNGTLVPEEFDTRITEKIT